MSETGSAGSASPPLDPSRLVHALGQPVIATDLTGVVTLWNAAAEEAFGWSAAEAVGRRVAEMTVPQGASQEQATQIMAALAAGEPWTGEFLLRRRDGSTFPALVTDTAAYDETGQLIGIVGVTTDLTARRRAEDALAEAHRRFAGMVGHIQDVLVLLDAELAPRYLSPSLTRLLGHPESDPTQIDFFDLVHPDDRAGLRGVLDDCRRSDCSSDPCELRLRHVDGDWRIVEATAANLLDDPSVASILLTCHDVTARRAAQARNRQLAALVEGATNPIYATDRDGRLTDWNAAAERLFGYSAAEVWGQPVSLIIPPDLRSRAAGVLAQVANGQDVDGYATEALCRDGRRVALSVRVSPIRDSSGRVVGTSRIVWDMTAQRHAEAAVRASEERLRAVLANSPLVVIAIDIDGVLTFVEGKVLAELGRTPDHFVGLGLDSFSDIVPEVVRAARRSLDGTATASVTTVAGRHYDVQFVPSRDPDGRICGALGVATDITDLVTASEQMAASEERWRSLVSHSADAAVIADGDGVLTYASPAFTRLFGWSAPELVGTSGFALVHPDDLSRVQEAVGSVLVDPDAHPVVEFRLRARDGSWRWVEETVSNLLGHPRVQGLIGNLRDVTDRHIAGEALRTSEAHYRVIVETAQEAICLLDAEGSVLVGNSRLAELVGRPLARIAGTPGAQLIDGLDAAIAATATKPRRARRRDLYELSHTPRSGPPVDLVVAASPLHTAAGKFSGSLIMITDVTQRKRAEAELARLALHDSLTGLPNRALLADRLAGALGRRTSHSGQVAVLFVDLDQFKAINDGLGHAAGDAVLTAIAGRLADAVRGQDTVGRLGGDEFVILAENLKGTTAATALADRILDALTTPIKIGGIDVVVSASIGIALTTAPESITAQELLHRADMAMYRAKSHGRACWATHEQARGGPVVDQLALLGELRTALARNELRLHYQPQVRLVSSEVVGVEALLRWEHPQRGLLLPAAFLDVAEGSGLIRDIGSWVLRTACRQAARWHAGAPDVAPLTMSVNLSARQLDDPALAAKVADILVETGVDPASLVLEMTETALMSDADAALSTLTRLKALGVRLAIDDFGTGYSSMVYLKRFPVDELKIDRSFVAGLGEDPEDSAIVACVVQLATAVGIRAVAEGVETEHQRRRLQAMGCELGQGYLWGAPKPAADVVAVAARSRACL